MAFNPDNPLIIQSDFSVLIEVDNPKYEDARNALIAFAELIKSPEHIHTYKITPLSIWNACAANFPAENIISELEKFAKYDIPEQVTVGISDFASRYGRLKLTSEGNFLYLNSDDKYIAEEIYRNKNVKKYIDERKSELVFIVKPFYRGIIKQSLIKAGFPVEDLAGYTKGEALNISLRSTSLQGEEFSLRNYQNDACKAFYANGKRSGGSGVIVMPCGAGKTIIGMGCMSQINCSTLILTTNVTAIRQWKNELLDKTHLKFDQIGEYSGKMKVIAPVTISTYQMITYRKSKEAEFENLKLFNKRDWGLIIYDEVHTLPAPVFQITSSIQTRRRLGLTATLVREDGREDDVFALIGPKKAEIPWKIMEKQGWIAKAVCTEIRIDLPKKLRMPYALANRRLQFRIASENSAKIIFIKQLLEKHKNEKILIIGMYIDQLKLIAEKLNTQILTGATPQKKRDRIFNEFKNGNINVLIVSKIANFAVDLPNAAIAIQISGTFGSRQEEAQRLGRILRPKKGTNQAHFYSIISCDTVEQEFALKRQMFLCEQGYEYHIEKI